MLDTRLVGRIEWLEYATDMLYAPALEGEAPVADVAAFKDQRLNDPTRTLPARIKKSGLMMHCARALTGGSMARRGVRH